MFESIRSWFNPPPMHEAPQYGRGIHALPNPKEQELFDEASEGFVHGDTLLGYERFLSSLLHCNGTFPEPHLNIRIEEDSIRFTLIQGYALVRGIITQESLQAHADIAYSQALHVAMKRRFLERNFQLTYCRFSDTDGIIRLSIQLNNATVTPQKIFFPLREIALNADYEKEFIASEFDESLLLDCDHIIPIPHDRAKHYFEWMKKWIAQTRQSLIGLLSNDNTGMVSFSYLALLLQIDYLLLPHKKMAKNISEKINGYFMDDEKLTEDKNAELEKYLSELEAMNVDEFSSQLYDSAYTFSPFDQAMHDEIASFIDESLGKVRWYKNNRSNYVISVIYRYISLYVLYNYGLHPSLRALLHLHIEVYTADFFKEQGDIPLYDFETCQFQKNLIAKRIAEAIEPYTSRYKGLRNFSDSVNYSDLDHFSQSFYLQIKNLDFTES